MEYSSATITLYRNIPLDNKYENHPIYCDSFINYDNDKIGMSNFEEFIDHIYYDSDSASNVYDFPRTTYENINFIFNNLLLTSIVLELDNDVDLNANYLRVETSDRKYYYFITNVEVLNAKTVSFQLELDVLATYSSEFINGISDKPIYTERKHCNRFYREPSTGTTHFYCPDLLLNDSVLGDVNAQNMIDKPTQLVLSVYDTIKPVQLLPNSFLNKLNWLYYSNHDNNTFMKIGEFQASEGGSVLLPFTMGVMPIGFDGLVIYHPKEEITNQSTGETTIIEEFQVVNNQKEMIKKLFDSTNKYSARVSPYPPFTSKYGGTKNYGYLDSVKIVEYTDTTDSKRKLQYLQLTIKSNVDYPIFSDDNYWYFGLGDCGAKFSLKNGSSTSPKLYYNKDIEIFYQPSSIHKLEVRDNDTDLIFPMEGKLPKTFPYIFEKNKDYEPRLWCYPLYKVELNTLSSNALTLYPQITYAGNNGVPYDTAHSFKTIASCYGGDFTFFTYYENGSIYAYQNILNQGVTTSPDYTFPYGQDALTKFNDTQGSSYATSKIVQGVAGIGTAIGGAALTAMSGGTGGMIGGGMIVSGLTATTEAVTSSIAKYNDLSKTPDTLQSIGGSFAHDIGHNVSLLPFITYYRVNESMQNMYFDYFYNYGYMVNRNCHFTTGIKDWNLSNGIDYDLLRREYFNYVKIKEDITTKIDEESIPPTAKAKISTILNNGIKLWTFWHYDEYFGYKNNKGSTLKIRDRYLNQTFENSEYER